MKKILLLLLCLVSLFCKSQTTVTRYILENKDTLVLTETISTTTVSSNSVVKIVKPFSGNDTIVPVPPTGYILLLQNNADVLSDLDPRNHEQYGNGFIDNSFKLNGTGSFKSRPAEVSGGVRSEIQYDGSDTPIEGASEWDEYIRYIVADGCHEFQIHPAGGSGSAILAMWHTAGKFNVRTNDGSNHDQNEPMQAIQVGRWYHMKVEWKFGTGSYYRWYINGVLYSKVNANERKMATGGNLKWGFNGGFFGGSDPKAEAKKSDISYDNLKVYRKQ